MGRRHCRVRLAGRPLRNLNDLEFLRGSVYACVLWHSDIYEICTQTGEVLRVVDCTELIEKSGRERYDDLMNGIAFAPDRGTFFVTGKNWPMLSFISGKISKSMAAANRVASDQRSLSTCSWNQSSSIISTHTIVP